MSREIVPILQSTCRTRMIYLFLNQTHSQRDNQIISLLKVPENIMLHLFLPASLPIRCTNRAISWTISFHFPHQLWEILLLLLCYSQTWLCCLIHQCFIVTLLKKPLNLPIQFNNIHGPTRCQRSFLCIPNQTSICGISPNHLPRDVIA